EGTGGVAVDSSCNGRNGTLVNGPTWSTGIKNGALSFDGVNDKVTLPANLIRDYTTLTISLWFKSSTNGIILGMQNGPGNNMVPVFYLGNDGKLRGAFWAGTSQVAGSANIVTDGQWHHAALTGAVNTQSLYLDGNLVNTLVGQIAIDHLDMTINQLGAGIVGAWAGG